MDTGEKVMITGAGVQSGVATVTIPMEITVRLGRDDGEAARHASAFVVARGEAGRLEETSDDPRVVAAIALARRNRDRSATEYYDEQGDAADRQAYYRHIDTNVEPSALYTALSSLVTDTHRTKLEYSPSTQLYPDVDLQPNGTIESIYSSARWIRRI